MTPSSPASRPSPPGGLRPALTPAPGEATRHRAGAPLPTIQQNQVSTVSGDCRTYWQAIALADANGLTATDILPHATETMMSMPQFMSLYASRIDAGQHDGDVDRLAMGMASVEHVLHSNADAGVDTVLPAAVVSLCRRGLDAGHCPRQLLPFGRVDEEADCAVEPGCAPDPRPAKGPDPGADQERATRAASQCPNQGRCH